MDYQRYKMCPSVTTYDTAGKAQYKLDYLNAGYLKIKQVQTYTIFIVTSDMMSHPDLIAYKFYESVDLWWVVCLYNDIIDPVTELYPGRSLKIPDISELNQLINPSGVAQLNTTKIVVVA